MPESTVGQQLAEAHAENERLRALLPPDVDPDLVARAGRRQPCNLYVGFPGDEDGYLLGKMPTPEWAEHVIRALNAINYGMGTVSAENLVKAAALREFAKQINDGPAQLPMPPSIIAAMALERATDLEYDATSLAEAADL